MEATHEERMKVRRDECAVHGHSWDAIMVYGHNDPVRFVCSNCGRGLSVMPEEGGAEPPILASTERKPGE